MPPLSTTETDLGRPNSDELSSRSWNVRFRLADGERRHLEFQFCSKCLDTLSVLGRKGVPCLLICFIGLWRKCRHLLFLGLLFGGSSGLCRNLCPFDGLASFSLFFGGLG